MPDPHYINNVDVFGENLSVDDSSYEANKNRQAQYTYDTKKGDFADNTYNTKKDALANYAFQQVNSASEMGAAASGKTRAFAAESTSNGTTVIEKVTPPIPISLGGTGADSAQGAANAILGGAGNASTLTGTDAFYLRPSGGSVSRSDLSALADFSFDAKKGSIFDYIKQAVFNAVHPINEVYVQYPGQKDPNALYAVNGITCVWTFLEIYDGAFFRASGTGADPFIEENQTLTPQAQSTAVVQHHHNGSASFPSGSSLTTDCETLQGEILSVSSTDVLGADKVITSPIGNNAEFNNSNNKIIFSKGDTTNNAAPINKVPTTDITSGCSLKVDASHSHTLSLSGQSINLTVGNAKSPDNNPLPTNTWPKNYTIKIWKRTA